MSKWHYVEEVGAFCIAIESFAFWCCDRGTAWHGYNANIFWGL